MEVESVLNDPSDNKLCPCWLVDYLLCLPASAKCPFDTLPALDAYYRKTSILCGLGHTKEHKPQHTLQCGRDRECHLCKREYIEDYARSQDDDTGAE